MGEIDPLALRQELHQVLLDLRGVGVFREAQSLAQSRDVRIDHDARRDSKGRAKHDVRRFASDARQRDHLIHIARHFAAVLFDDALACRLDVLGLVAEEAGALNHFFQLLDRRIGHFASRRPAAEQFRRDHVHARVGALGRKDRRDQQLERRFVFEGTSRARIIGLETANDAGRMGDCLGVQLRGQRLFRAGFDLRGRCRGARRLFTPAMSVPRLPFVRSISVLTWPAVTHKS